MPVVPRLTWEAAREAYLERVRPWVQDRQRRKRSCPPLVSRSLA